MRFVSQHTTRPASTISRVRHAFTVIELLVVLSIIGIIASMAIPRIDASRYRVDAAARGIRGTLQQAQRLAIVRQHDVIVSFDATTMRLRTLEDRNNDAIVDADERSRWIPMQEGARFLAPPTGLKAGTPAALIGSNYREIDGMPSIVFHSDGAASTEAEVYVTSATGAPQHFRAITLVQSTGRTEWFRFSNGSWKRG